MAHYNNAFLNFLDVNYKDGIKDYLNEVISCRGEIFGHRLINKTNAAQINNLVFCTVDIVDKGDLKVEFDLHLKADVEIKELKNDGSIHGHILRGKWFTITLGADIEKEIQNLNIVMAYEYDGSDRERRRQINGDLVPNFTEYEDYEKYLTKYLKKHVDKNYDGSELLNLFNVARALKLNVYNIRFAGKNKSSFGKIYFDDGECEVLDENDNAEEVKIDKNSVLVDVKKNDKNSERSKNITLSHEICHFILHRKSYFFYKLLDNGLTKFECDHSDVGISAKGIPVNVRKKIETQAMIAAPILLMPKKALVEYTNKLYVTYSEHYDNDLDFIESLIKNVARHFNVTIYAARRRLKDLGYFKKVEAMLWIDGKYITPFAFRGVEMGNNDTFVLSTEQLFKLRKNNELKRLIDSERFVFVENHLCLNDKRYLYYNDLGDLELRPSARKNVAKCCLKFTLVDTTKYDKDVLTVVSLCRDDNKQLCYDIKEIFIPGRVDNRLSSERRKKVRENINEAMASIKPLCFEDALKYLIKFQKMSQQELADSIGVSRKTIERWVRKDEKGTLPTDKKSFVRLCIGLKLCKDLSIILASKLNISFDEFDDDDNLYLMILSHMTSLSVPQIVARLEKINLSHLL